MTGVALVAALFLIPDQAHAQNAPTISGDTSVRESGATSTLSKPYTAADSSGDLTFKNPPNIEMPAGVGGTATNGAEQFHDVTLPVTALRMGANNGSPSAAMSGTPQMATLRQQAAGTVVAADWSLIPADLAGGDQFRLIFLSSTKRDGSSPDVADYNTFIQNLAAGGHGDIRAYTSGFRVVGCTTATDARDNTGTTYTSTDKGVPIYWLGGAKVADDYQDFYNGSWDEEANDKDESGANGPDTSLSANYPFTGCDHNGTESFFAGVSGALGNGSTVRIGQPNDSSSGNGPISSSLTTLPGNTQPFYGLSEVFQVASSTVFEVVSTDATLSDLRLTDDDGAAVTLAPAFASGTTDYTASLADSVDEITIIPTVNESNAAYAVQDGIGTALEDADSNENDFQVALSPGTNTIKVVVTAQDAVTSSTYTVVIMPPAAMSGTPQVVSTDATLSDLRLTDDDGAAVTLTPAFASGTTDYTASLADSVDEITIIPTVNESNAAYAVQDGSGTALEDADLGAADFQVALSPGTNTIKVEVTAQDSVTSSTYTVVIMPPAAMSGTPQVVSTDATLSSLRLKDDDGAAVKLTPAFASGTTDYTASLADSVDEVTIIPTVNESNATYAVQDGSGTALEDADSNENDFQVALSPGTNTIKVEVTAQDAVTSSTYTVVIMPPAAMLRTPPEATLRQQAAGTVVAADWSLVPRWVGSGEEFRLLVLSSGERDASENQIGPYNSFIQGLAAQGHADIQAYSAGFRVVGCTFNVDARDNTGTTYTSTDKGVPIYWLNRFLVAVNYEDFYDGSWDNEGTNRNELGEYGRNTAESGNQPFTGCLNDGTGITSGTFRTLGAAGGSVRIGGLSTVGLGPLDGESNSDSTNLRPMYGLSEVFRVESSDATLSDLELKDDDGAAVTLTPAFASGTTDYTASVAHEVVEVTIIPVNESNATYEIQDGSGTALVDADSNEDDFQVEVAKGANSIKVVVTAEDALTTLTYTVAVTRGLGVSPDWSLVPAGFAPGDKFRLVFLSSTKRDGSSSGIAAYNRFIQNRAAAGHTDIQGYSSGFRVVGCTEAVDARDNTETTYTNTDKGVPIYWLNGAKAADDYEDFYDGSWDDEANNKNESGNNGPNTVLTANYPFTGCNHNGTEAFFSGTSLALGNGGNVRVAQPDDSGAGRGPLSSAWVTSSSNTRPMYGLSEVFEVHSGDATLSGLELNDDGGAAVTLTPAFASVTTDYAGPVESGVDEITIIPTVNQSGATYEIQDGSGTGLVDADANEGDFQVALSVGMNTIKVVVTAQNAITSRAYTVVITRAASVPGDWSLLPSGLSPGDQFRLLFLSSTKRNGSSSGIAAYNTFIQDRAAAGHTDIQAYSSGFRVVGCTRAVDARDNTGTTYTGADKGVPIYWLNGAKVADDYQDFYNSSWDEERNDKNELGANGPDTSQAANYPITGCEHNGTESHVSGTSYALGSGSGVTIGGPNNSGSGIGPLSSPFTTGASNTRPMYGLSEVIQVPFDDATLSGLELKDDVGSAVTLTPAFASVTTDYAASVAHDVVEVTIIPMVNERGATYEIQDGSGTALVDADANEDDFQVEVAEGANSIKVVVTAQDTLTTQTYTVLVTLPGTEVSITWSLLPSGLSHSDRFRLLFLSSTKRDGSSSDIADYNTFIQNRAAAGHTDIQAYSSGFRVVGCTEAVDGRDNTGTTYTSADKGVPIYWLNGVKAADNYEDFYDGSWDQERNDKNEAGTNGPNTSQTVNYPLTGCDHDGTEFVTGSTSWALGNGGGVRVGRPDTSGSSNGPIRSSFSASSSETRPMYGLSEVFEVRVFADATLSDLELKDDGGAAITLTPAFAPGTTDYAAAAGVDEVTIIPTVNESNATYEVQDGSGTVLVDADPNEDDFQVALSSGATTINVVVTASDDATTQTYTVLVTLPATEVSSTWSLIPTGLVPGDPFRLLFLSSTDRDGSSSDIADYNTFIQDRAANGHADIRAYSSGFRVVGCTTAVDAHDNTGTTYISTYKGVPIYWLNGAKAVDDYEDFYDGSWDEEASNKNELGANGPNISHAANYPITGCDHDGTEHVSGSTSYALGSGSGVRVGVPNNSGSSNGPISSSIFASSSSSRPMYGLSEVFEVGTFIDGVTVNPTEVTVTEGGTATYTVVLDSEPTGNVTVTIQDPIGNTDVTADPATLTFTDQDWDTAQTVTVTAAQDDNGDDETTTITHSVAGYGTVTTADDVTVAVEDDDTAQVMGVMLTQGDAQLVLNWTAVANATGYKVQWKSGGESYNTGDRQATVTPGTSTSYTIGSLMNGTEYTVQVIATRTGANDGPPSAEVKGTPAAAGVTVSKTALAVTEEDTTGDTYTVVLTTQPAADVTVTVAGHSGTDVTPTPAALTFTSMTWDTAQAVTVTAGDDADTTNDTVSLTHSAASTDTDYDSIAIAGVTVTVEDNDTAQVMGVMVTPGDGQLVVNWTAVANATGYKVQWKSGGESYNTGDRQATVTPGTSTSYTIGSLMNGTEYTVRVIATRTGANDGPPSAEVKGTPAETGVTVTPTALTVTEQNVAGGTYTVVLTTQPTADVVVTVAGHSSTDVTPTPATLTFTSTTWDTAQAVTVTAGGDVDGTNDTVSLTHSAASTDTDYDAIVIAGVTVTVEDNDTAQVMGVMVTPGNAQLVLNWTAVANATGYKVQWKSGGESYNTGDRQATVTPGTTTDYTIGSLNNGTEYTVQVIAIRTGANDGPPSEEVKGTPAVPTVAVTVSYEEGTYKVTEDNSVTVKVQLDVDPERTLTIPITHTPQGGASAADYSGVPANVTFNSGDTEKTFTFTAPTDSDDDDGESVKLAFGPLPAGVSEGTTNEAVVSIVDDILPVVTITPDLVEAISNLPHRLFDVPVPTYTLTRTGSTARSLRVDLQIPENPFVYRPNGETVTIPAGETSKQVKFDTIAYYYSQEAGTLTVEVAARDRYVLGTPSTASITMQRIESPITLELMDGPSFNLSEGAGTVTFTVVATTAAGLPAPSRGWETDDTWQMKWGLITFAGGLGATANADYVPFSQTRDVTGAWVADGDHFRHESTFRLEIIDDMIDEPDEGLALILTPATQPLSWQNYIHRVCPDVSCRHTVTIIDNDAVGVTASKTALAVTEEDTTGDTYTVVLDGQPAADVTVTVAGHSGTDVTPTPATLTFTSMTWDTAQTVTVTAGDDADTTNDTVSLTHSAASTDTDYGAIAIAGVTVTVNDNDTAQVMGVTVAPRDAQLVLNWTAVANATGYKVQWKSGAEDYNTGDRQATVTPGTTTAYTIGGLSNGTEYTVRVIATRTGANDGPPSEEVKGTPAVPTVAGVTVSKTALTVTEEDTTGDTYTVVLDTQPAADVTVTVAGHSGTDVTLTPATLTFTSTTWDTAQAVTVTAGGDVDGTNDTVSLTHSAASTDTDYDDVAIAGVTVTVDDDETASTEVILAVNPAWVDEDTALTSVRLTAELNEAPRSELTTVTVTVGASGDSAVEGTHYETIGELTLTIRAGQTSMFQTILFRPVNTGIGEGDRGISITGTTTAPGLTVTETALVLLDDETTRSMTLTAVPDSVAEDGSRVAVVVTVTLDDYAYLIETPVTITVGDPGDSATEGTDYASVPDANVTILAGATSAVTVFQFTPGNDDFGEGDEKISVTGRSTGHSAVVNGTEVTIVDDDTLSTEIALSISSDSLGEGADATTLTVTGTLNNDPRSSPTSVTVMVGAASDAAVEGTDFETVNDFTLTIDAGQTTGSTTFQFIPTDDAIDEVDEALTVWGTTDAMGLTIISTSVTITDDDDRVTITPTEVTVTEGGTVTYTVVLGSQPLGDVTVTINDPTDNADVTADPASLTFTTTDWSVAQTVTVSAAQDADDADETATITHTVASAADTAYEGFSADDVAVTLNDDAPGTLTVNFGQGTYTATEGSSVTVKVQLSVDPERTVTIPITHTPQDGASAADYSGVPANVTFNSGDTEKTFSFTAAADSAVDAGESVKLTFGTLPAGVSGGATTESVVSIADLSVSFGQGTYTAAEGGSITVTVKLSVDPERTVTIPITHTPQGGATSADYSGVPANVTFNSGDTEKTFSLAAAADSDDDDGESVKLTFGTLPTGVSEGATNESVVSITDDDTAGVTITPTEVTVTESGTSTYTVVLGSQPLGDVTVTVNDPTDNADVTADPASLTFTTTDWSVAQTVTVSAAQDGDVADETATVTHTVISTADADYQGISTDDVAVTLEDDDVPVVTVSYEQGTYTVDEASSTTVKVQLDMDPERTVTVPITHTPQDGATAADYSGVPTSVTFNGGDTEKTFTVTAPTDSDDDDGESVKLGFGTLPAGVSEGTTNEAVVKILDDILPVVTITPDVDTANSNIDRILFDLPWATHTVTRTGGTNTALRVDLYVPDNPHTGPLSIPVRIPVGATSVQTDFLVGDVWYNEPSGPITIEVAESARYVVGAPSTASIAMERVTPVFTLELKDGPSYEVSEDAGTVRFTIVATTAPGLPAPSRQWETHPSWYVKWGLVSQALSLGTTPYDDYLPISSLRDVTGAWEADGDHFRHESTFQLQIVDDMIAEPEEGLSLSIFPSTYFLNWNSYFHRPCPNASCRYIVTIIDDDTVGVTVSKSALTVTEEDTTGDTYTVVLESQPTADVVVTVAGHAGTDVTAALTTLTFTSLNWETPQTVTVTAGNDADTTNDSVTLTHSAASTDSGYDGFLIADVTVTVEDNDTAQVMGVMVTPRDAQLVLNWTAVANATGYKVQWKSGGESYNTGDRQATVTPGTTTDYTIGSLNNGTEYTVQVIAIRTGANDGPPSEEVKGTPTVAVTVSYEQGTYRVTEDNSVTVKVQLDVDPERTLTIPINHTPQGGATSADYSGVPANVTFNSGDTEKTFSFTAAADSAADDGESVKLTFGTLPTGVSGGATNESVVSIADLGVSFGQGTYTVAEGGSITVTVKMSVDPERTVTIPITHTPQGGATSADYSGVPANVTFNSGDTEKTFSLAAAADSDDDDGESVKLTFGTLPTGVSGGATTESVVSITDDDVPAVTVSFAQAVFRVIEGESESIRVNISPAASETIVIPITWVDEAGATPSDYSGVPGSISFSSGDTQQSFTVTAVDDQDDDDNEWIRLGFGPLPAGVTSGRGNFAAVSIVDNDVPAVTVSYEQGTYTVAEGSSVTVKVKLDVAPERTVTVPITHTPQDGATAADYSGVPTSVTFNGGDTEKTFSFAAASDSVDDDGESVKLTFGTLPTGVTAGTTNESVVSITDDDVPAVTVRYGQGTYTATEGSSVTVTVQLSVDPERTVTIPITHTPQDGASAADYSGVPANVTFNSGDTEKTFSFTAASDSAADDGESVKLTFGTLPTGVSGGATTESVVSIADLSVSFGQGTYTVAEGGSITVTVKMSVDPERTVTIPITHTPQGGATSADYSGVPANVTFNSGDTEKTFSLAAATDTVDDDGESVKLTFGTLPTGVSGGATNESVVSITDDDTAGVTITPTEVTVTEGGTSTYTVVLGSQPLGDVTVTINDPIDNTDVTADPASLTFTTTDWSVAQTVTVSAAQDADDADETATITHTVASADDTAYEGISADDVAVTLNDDAPGTLTVNFGQGTYTATEGSSVTVKVQLDVDPERTVTIPITHTPQDGASAADYSGVPANVTFNSGDTEKTFSFTAAADSAADAGESVKLTFGTLPTGVSGGATTESVVSIADLSVSFGQGTYTATEGSSVTVKVQLSVDPERTVTIPITHTPQGGATSADYSGVPANVTFNSGDTEKTFSLAAAADSDDDDGESVKLTFGTLPTGVSGGATNESVVSITDDDTVGVTITPTVVTVTEGGTSTYTVVLGSQPLGDVTVTINDPTDNADVTADPASLTFTTTDWSVAQTVTVSAAQDADDADETATITHTVASADDTAYEGISADDVAVTLNDDAPATLTVNFKDATYTATEGAAVDVTVTLNLNPERTVTIPINHTPQGGATSADYSGVPANVTFNSGDTEKTFSFTAASDSAADAGESVKLTFGTLPSGVSGGATNESVVSVADLGADDDVPTVSFDMATYVATEGGPNAAVTVELSAPAPRQVEILLTAEGQGGATPTDWSGVPESLTFNAGDTSMTFTFIAVDDNVKDDGEVVDLGFGILPDGFAAGSPATARVTLVNDEIAPPEPGRNQCPDDSGERMVLVRNGDISQAGESDFWRVELDPWRSYVIEVLGSDGESDILGEANPGGLTLSDPHLYGVWSGDGSELIRRTGTNRRARVIVARADDLSGFHQFEVRSFGGNTGTYQIKIRVNNICVMSDGKAVYSYSGGPDGYTSDRPADPSTGDTFRLRPRPSENISQSFLGFLGDNWDWYWDRVPDEDWLAIEGVSEDYEYTINVETIDDLPAKHQATRLKILGIKDSNGIEISGTSSAGSGRKVSVTFQPPDTGTFYVVVGSETPDRTGVYQIKVSSKNLQVDSNQRQRSEPVADRPKPSRGSSSSLMLRPRRPPVRPSTPPLRQLKVPKVHRLRAGSHLR